MAKWTRIKTRLPNAKDDYTVRRDGMEVGRVMRVEHGPRAGQWCWSGFWGGFDNRGSCETMEGALEDIQEKAPGNEEFDYRKGR